MPETATTKTGWTTAAFGNVVQQVKDKVDPEESGLERYVAGEHMDTDDLRIRRWGEIGDDYLGPAFHMRFKPGHVLYGSRRTYLRKVALADFEGITANTTYVLESKDPGGHFRHSASCVRIWSRYLAPAKELDRLEDRAPVGDAQEPADLPGSGQWRVLVIAVCDRQHSLGSHQTDQERRAPRDNRCGQRGRD